MVLALELWAVDVPKENPGLDIPKHKVGRTTYYCRVNFQGITLESDSLDGLLTQVKKLAIPTMSVSAQRVDSNLVENKK